MNASIKKLYSFFDLSENLKSTLRNNYTRTGRQESAADHTWRLILMTFITAKEIVQEVNIDKAIRIAIIHDIVESITKDSNYAQIIKTAREHKIKEEYEWEAIKKLSKALPEKTGKTIFNLWEEYEICQTKEAKFVKAMDKIEALTQLVNAGYRYFNKPDQIPNYADRTIKEFPQLAPILEEIKSRLKEEYKKGGIKWKKNYEKIMF